MAGETTPSYLELSDEEILNMPMPTGGAVTTAPVVAAVEAEDPQDPPAAVETPAVTTPPATEVAATPVVETPEAGVAPSASVEGDGTAAAPSVAPGAAQVTPAADGKPVEVKKETPVADPAPVTETPAIDYKAEYEKLLAPFKANGREVAVKSVEDAVSLMQMGANYNKKMAALKPILKLTKMLENNGLLSEEKISFLIDLDKKNPAAINKLVKDSQIDPMDLSADKASEYKQTAYTVDDREIELDTVLDELQGSAAYTRTLEIVSTKWDGASKQTIATHPQILKVLHDHVDRGIYDIISREMDNERMLGRLNGLSDIDAYKQVGDAIQARGGFAHLAPAKPAAPSGATPAAATPVVVTPPKPKVDEDKLKDKRRAASSTKPVASTPASAADFNPLNMSDEDFAKVATPKFS